MTDVVLPDTDVVSLIFSKSLFGKQGGMIMPYIVRNSESDVITLPPSLMRLLNLCDGDEVKTLIDGHSLRLTPLERFLSLRGVLSGDETFDRSMEQLDQEWQSWTDESAYRLPEK